MTMTDAKHTPGPWEVVPSIPEEGYNCFWLKGPNGENLADISGYQSDQTKQANAQLIARAPDLLAENETLKKRISELEAAQKWQPIDTAPRDGTPILVRDEPSVVIPTVTRSAYCRVVKWVFGRGFSCEKDRKVTGWMPLPKMENNND